MDGFTFPSLWYLQFTAPSKSRSELEPRTQNTRQKGKVGGTQQVPASFVPQFPLSIPQQLKLWLCILNRLEMGAGGAGERGGPAWLGSAGGIHQQNRRIRGVGRENEERKSEEEAAGRQTAATICCGCF